MIALDVDGGVVTDKPDFSCESLAILDMAAVWPCAGEEKKKINNHETIDLGDVALDLLTNY